MSLIQKATLILLIASATPVLAQDAPPPPPADTPPQIVITDDTGKELAIEDLQPEVTITPKDDKVVTEYRVRGRVYLIKVKPKNAPPYYLVDPEGDGQFNRIGGGIDETIRAPMWVIKSW